MTKRNILIITAIIITIFSAAGCLLLNYNNYASIQKYVSRNQYELRSIAASMLAGGKVKLPSKIKSAQVFEGTNTIVEFYLPSFTKQYCGFYYSENDIPAAFQNADIPLIATGEKPDTLVSKTDTFNNSPINGADQNTNTPVNETNKNPDTSLNKSDKPTWEWSADGDNHGKTIKISDNWYYFEASF